MTTKALLDPEILPALEAFPELSLQRESLPMFREAALSLIEMTDADAQGVMREEIQIDGRSDDQPKVRCLVYRPKAGSKARGAYLHLHGGGYILGSPEHSDLRNTHLSKSLGIVIVAVAYRLAPEHPAPSGLEDAFTALGWMHENAEDLGIDASRIAVGGESAGGGLAAALAQRAREDGRYKICFQCLTYPMLDHTTGSDENPGDPLTGEFVWTREMNQLGWTYYLGGGEPAAPAVPSAAKSVKDLPPTWMATATLDLFRDENIEYASRLMKAGVSVELVVYPGACHGFQLAETAKVSQRYYRDHDTALGNALNSSGWPSIGSL